MNKYFTNAGYLLLIIFIVFIILTSIGGSSSDIEALQMRVEWITKYVLPWVFLYYFIQFVKKNK